MDVISYELANSDIYQIENKNNVDNYSTLDGVKTINNLITHFLSFTLNNIVNAGT